MASPSSYLQQDCHLEQVQAFAQLCRPILSLLAAIAGSLMIYVLAPTTPTRLYLLTAVVLFCITAAAFAINDYDDVEKDRINHPERPLPSGRLSPQQAWWTAVLLFAVALITALFLGRVVWLLVAVSTVLLWHYSAILTVSGILGNGVVATIVAALFLLSGLVAARPLAVVYPGGFLFCYILAKEIVWDIHDAEGDRKRGVYTIANRWGAKIAFAVAWGLLSLLLISIPIAILWLPMTSPPWFGFCAAAMVVSFMVALGRYGCAHTTSTYKGLLIWGRFGMVIGLIGLSGVVPPT